jgi:transcription termination/antitermination protein NusA
MPEIDQSVGISEPQKLSDHTEAYFDARRRELGNIPGITTLMLFALGEHGIRSVEDLADCVTDDLDGWNEFMDGRTIKHVGILDRFRVSRQDCAAMIMNARTKAGWFK